MNLGNIKPGKYILAVSGGVDSIVLLDLLAKKPGIDLVVAHFNHGIRRDADCDERLVQGKAKELGLVYESGRARLGAGASEEAARHARYAFLEKIKQKHKARMIITAHHQDDLIETAFINILRGTGRKGVTAIMQNPGILRPLLPYSKQSILEYAQKRKLEWHDDTTNSDESYLRNYIRKNLTSSLTKRQREKILDNIDNIAKYNVTIDSLIAKISQNITNHEEIDRQKFTMLPVKLADELVALWLRQNRLGQFDKKTVNRLSIALKTAKSGSSYPIQGDLRLLIGHKTARFSQGV